jgi:hypothetical protein
MQELIKQALAIAATLINIPEAEEEGEKFFQNLRRQKKRNKKMEDETVAKR